MNPSTCYARNYELDKLAEIFKPDGPDIIALYGITGIGKTTLLKEFITNSEEKIFMINCQLVEPTAQSFKQAFSQLLKLEDSTLESMAQKIKQQHIIVLDQFESFKLLETWFRREFMATMYGKIRLVFSGRVAPDYQWLLNPPSHCRYYSLNLSSLSFHDSIAYLQLCGHSKLSAMAINQFASGHPVALHLASAAILEHPGRELFDIPLENVIQTLADYFVEDIQDPELRRAVEATSTVRRVSESVLAAMLDLDDKSALYNKLGHLSFIEHRPDGLSLHDVLKHALATTLKARSPNKFSEYRNKASRILRQEMRTADSSNLWRYTADIIYLVDNRAIRDAFFPPNDHREYSVEPAQPTDKESIMAIINKHEPQASQEIYQHWYTHAPDTFHSVKNKTNTVVGFYCLINPALVSDNLIQNDPITAAWWLDHQQKNNLENTQQALFLRRWLSSDEGESPSAIQAACWLDIKRSYLAMRPNLRRVYLTLEDIAPYAMAAQSLGFTALDITIKFNQRIYLTAMLDFGEYSVDGWIAKTLVNEINESATQAPPPIWFDKAARQLVLDQQRTDLTPLEFDTLSLLISNQGVVLSRKELLEKVWKIHYQGASNVVDTVILSLRKKLQDKAILIQSVRGIGYRFITTK